MANVYFKIMNKSLANEYSNKIINALQDELAASANIIHENLYDELHSASKRTPLIRNNTLDINNILKYYIINQVLNESKNKKNINNRYVATPNKNYVKDPFKNEYYRITENGIKPAENIKEIRKDGSYVIIEKVSNSCFTTKKIYDNNDEVLSIQLLKRDGTVVNSKIQVVELMGMRKEYTYRYKYAGYSGNSNDILTAFMNRLCAPVETGYYMDKRYNLFSWDEHTKCFYRKMQDSELTPLLFDYEFENSQRVIRKEYTGIK